MRIWDGMVCVMRTPSAASGAFNRLMMSPPAPWTSQAFRGPTRLPSHPACLSKAAQAAEVPRDFSRHLARLADRTRCRGPRRPPRQFACLTQTSPDPEVSDGSLDSRHLETCRASIVPRSSPTTTQNFPACQPSRTSRIATRPVLDRPPRRLPGSGGGSAARRRRRASRPFPGALPAVSECDGVWVPTRRAGRLVFINGAC